MTHTNILSAGMSHMGRALRGWSLAVLALGTVTVGGPAHAAVVYQSVPNLADTSHITGAFCSPCGTSYRAFDQFTLTQAATITGASIGVLNEQPEFWPTNVNLSIFSVTPGNLPGTQLFSQTITAANWSLAALGLSQGNGFPVGVAHTDAVTGLSLAAGTYKISFSGAGHDFAPTLYTGVGSGQFWESTSLTNGTYIGGSMGFTLFGSEASVPAPGALALLGLGLFGIGGLRRKSKATI